MNSQYILPPHLELVVLLLNWTKPGIYTYKYFYERINILCKIQFIQLGETLTIAIPLQNDAITMKGRQKPI